MSSKKSSKNSTAKITVSSPYKPKSTDAKKGK